MTVYDDHDLSGARDKTGGQYGRWTVISFADTHVTPGGQSIPRWNCRCSCGVTRAVRGADLASGKSRSCGCLHREIVAQPALDLTGQRFGRLVAQSHLASDGSSWQCLCDCGTAAVVATDLLRSGRTKSCGCFRSGPTSRNHKDLVTYASAHCHIRRKRGSAKRYPCVDCERPAYDWSYEGGDPAELNEWVRGSLVPYSLDMSRYVPRCRSCHKVYDLGRRAA